jgi:hypothetical protein
MSIGTRIPNTQFGDVLRLVNNRPVFTADYYAVDGVSGKVASFIDWNDATHTLAQASSGSQVAIPAVHADFNGKLCATFTGAEQYTSNRAAPSWAFRHQGISSEEFCVITPTGVSGIGGLHDTSATATTFGTYTFVGFATSTWRAAVLNAAGSVALSDVGAVAIGTPTYLGLAAYGAGGLADSKFTKFVKSVSTAMTTAAAPSALTSNLPLTLGSRVATTQRFIGRWRASLFSYCLGPDERTAMYSWIQQDTAITP